MGPFDLQESKKLNTDANMIGLLANIMLLKKYDAQYTMDSFDLQETKIE